MRELTLGPESPSGGSLLKGQELATTFSFLRPNDLVWNYVVGNYLKGETPPPFDLLYWNGDSTNLPGPMYCWYLRNTYLENNLVEPGKPRSAARRSISARSTCRPTSTPRARTTSCRGKAPTGARGALKGKLRFVLGASGHIAGVINPPTKRQAQPLDRRRRCAADGSAAVVRRRQGAARAAGGPTGRAGWSGTPASRCRRRRRSARPATSRSSRRRDVTSRRRPDGSRAPSNRRKLRLLMPRPDTTPPPFAFHQPRRFS